MSYITEAEFYRYAAPAQPYLNSKRAVEGWGAPATNVYTAYQTGEVTVLFQAGADLGAAEALIGDLSENGEWFYNAATDALSLYSDTDDPSEQEVLAGEDHATYMTAILDDASRDLDSRLDARYPTPLALNRSDVYEKLIKQLTSYCLATLVTVGRDQELFDFYEDRLTNLEGTGIVDEINSGKRKFQFEIDAQDSRGEIKEVSVAGGLKLIETRGNARGVDWDAVKVKVITGGALATATYSVWVKDGTTIKNSQVITAELITGDFQTLAYGLEIRFRGDDGDTATANDEWEIDVRGEGEQVTNASIQSSQDSRYGTQGVNRGRVLYGD